MDKEWKIDPLTLKIIGWYRSGDKNTQEKVRDILRRLIQHCGTQAKTAKALKIMRRTVTYRLNHAKVIHLEDALKMLDLLQSKKSVIEIWHAFIEDSAFSERVKMALDDLEKNRQPRGRNFGRKIEDEKTNLTKIPENFVKLTIKTAQLEEQIAIQYGFNNRETLRQALKIWQVVKVSKTGSPLMIQALDDNTITIYKAYRLLAQPFEIQVQLVQQERLKQKHRKPRKYFNPEKEGYLPLLQAFESDAVLNAIEQRTKEPIIKCIQKVLNHFFINQAKQPQMELSIY